MQDNLAELLVWCQRNWLKIAGIIAIAIIWGILRGMIYKAIQYTKSKDFDLVKMIKGLIKP
jgi:hypothetical protein